MARIAEVMLESLPQCLLQSYILITVMHHMSDHVESAARKREGRWRQKSNLACL